ncbi:hypothetical protein GO755_30805 [Spirosoma sp. HMF4905]|uniref:histidine kinase n=1 Tax=Spirosoma arboris TaxID=2682092 RepID=A0A7K1SKX6_9BACT|nr:sensor histidine kinase [Spirosoma arboris]MVM34461.1 hypothetical protein [Spirosoma arboris]
MDRVYLTFLFLISLLFRSGLAQPVKTAGFPDSINTYLPDIEPKAKLQQLKDDLWSAQLQHNKIEIGEISYRLGKFYQGVSQYLPARYWFLQSVRIREPLGPSADLVKLYIQLSSNYGIVSMQTRSLWYAQQALKTARLMRAPDSTHSRMSAYMVMGNLHASACQQGHTKASRAPVLHPLNSNNASVVLQKVVIDRIPCDSAFYYYKLALQQARLLNEPDEVSGITVDLGALWARINIQRAIPYYQAALANYISSQRPTQTVSTRLLLADCYLTLHKPLLARRFLEDAKQGYQTAHLNSPTLERRLASGYDEFYRQTGDYQKAYTYQKQVYEWKLAALNTDRNGAITRLGLEYETEKREAKLKSQQQALILSTEKLSAEQNLRNALLGGLGIAVGVGVALYRLYQINRRISRQNAQLVTEQNHRVKNNLQAISDLLTLQSFQLTDVTTKKVISGIQHRIQSIELLHKRLYDNPQQALAVKLNVYISELVIRILETYGLETIEPIYTINDVWLSADQTLPFGLILSEIVTNACKYAFVGHSAPQLIIRLECVGTTIQLVVHDNGPGFLLSDDELTTYGLKLVKMQVQQLKGYYTIINQNGTQFKLTFSLPKL